MQNEQMAVTHREVSCDGGKGALGHPKVYLYIGKEDKVVCPYCSRIFLFVNEKKETLEEQL